MNDPGLLEDLKQYLCKHLGLQFHRHLVDPQREFSEREKLSFLPLIFGLLPRGAVVRPALTTEVKPPIRDHLAALGTPADEVLVDLLKVLADNLYSTRVVPRNLGQLRKRKAGLSTIRQNASLYKEVRGRQNGRCSACGIPLTGGVEETLDHILPWRLGGDPEGATNWQLMCRPCNEGKSDLVSSQVTGEFYNWVSGGEVECVEAENSMSNRTRYVALMCHRSCSCGRNSRDARLFVVEQNSKGLSVFDHLKVVCEHCSSS